MRRDDLTDLNVFVAVAEERSFTRAAARLGLTQSTLSHTIRSFEERLGVRLLTRTTRSVALTEAGERLLRVAQPGIEAIAAELTALAELRDKPAGTVRITTSNHAHQTILWPALKRLLPGFPDIRVEVVIEHRFTDVVAERFDAGIRLGEAVERDMIAVRVGPDLRWIVVGSPVYFADRPAPAVPQDLTMHRCINYRNSTSGDLYAWEFEKEGRALNVRVEGALVFNDTLPAMEAAMEGFGLAYLPEDVAAASLRDGRLVAVLGDWCPYSPGYHLYYPSRRQPTPAFALLVDALRWR
ncbi:Transcriptional regulator, LysR family [Rubellimicrobium mesophilum DSM 19309]|uniref:Transcriptional regulator, LysR family n=1 Tax=Rubellimicrobium mesophilum DSM 19309 TaxID=442562 RepID=A0A017HLW8_9RHOB|nr:LysR family transcriptional regulator [Rubellimicrobium mesophilum]EYD74774.1 Transcriptional regulator, LysR family [Rubellimicrobium mesophilum DSM 19309]